MMDNNDPRLSHPFDLALPPPALEETECPARQADLLEAAITTSALNRQRVDDAEFFSQPSSSRRLSHYRDIYQRSDRHSAINLLTRRQKIDWSSSDYHISNQDHRLLWGIPHQYLDMIVCVSRDIGLGILLPNERNHTFTFQFDFQQPHRQFSAKFAKLGFDAKSSFLWVGKSPSHDDVFVAWAPIESLTEAGDQVEVGLCTGKTNLSQEHYRITGCIGG